MRISDWSSDVCSSDLWENGVAGLERYNRLVKVEPMQRALDELDARTWFSGLRRGQSQSRAEAQVLELRWGRWKVHPIVDWSDRDVGRYLARHEIGRAACRERV